MAAQSAHGGGGSAINKYKNQQYKRKVVRYFTGEKDEDTYEPNSRRKFKQREWPSANMPQSKSPKTQFRNPETSDPYPGKAPIPKNKLKKHQRGEGIRNFKAIKTTLRQKQMKMKEEKVEFSVQQMARSEMLLQEESGYLEADAGELTSQISQQEIVNSVDITSAVKRFDLNLSQYAPYRFSYTLNGRHLVIGGQRGHVAAFDWVTKKLCCEMNVMESVHDVKWLHVETMYSVAQKEHVFIYDNQGIELHCLKTLYRVLQMEFLPYHFLLATASEKGYLSWLDVSIGKIVSQYNTRLGRLDVMCQNPANAVLCLGHSKGIVTMWTPTQKQAAAKILCHQHPVRAMTVDITGRYMATSAVDRSLKIWDLRNFKCLQSYKIGAGASTLAFSQRGLLAAGVGNIVEVYKDVCQKAVDGPYMRHKLVRSICQVGFCPYEDVLGLGHLDGFSSILVPGAGEPNFDALERNPFQTKTQRREAEVKALLEKIQPEMITLDPHDLGDVDVPTLEEKFEAKKNLLYVRPQKINFKPRRVNRRGGTVKTAKVKKGHREEVKLREVKKALNKRDQFLEGQQLAKATNKKEDAPKKVLDRFRPKKKKKETL